MEKKGRSDLFPVNVMFLCKFYPQCVFIACRTSLLSDSVQLLPTSRVTP